MWVLTLVVSLNILGSVRPFRLLRMGADTSMHIPSFVADKPQGPRAVIMVQVLPGQ